MKIVCLGCSLTAGYGVSREDSWVGILSRTTLSLIHIFIDRRSPDCLPDWDLKSLVKVCFATYSAEECPLCKEGLPLVKPGSRPDEK